MIDLLRKKATRNGFTLKFVVTSAETVPFQRHPPGGLERWRVNGRGGDPPREDVQLTVAHLEPVYAHGETTTEPADSTNVHAMGGFDVRSVHAKAADTFVVGQIFDLALDGA